MKMSLLIFLALLLAITCPVEAQTQFLLNPPSITGEIWKISYHCTAPDGLSSGAGKTVLGSLKIHSLSDQGEGNASYTHDKTSLNFCNNGAPFYSSNSSSGSISESNKNDTASGVITDTNGALLSNLVKYDSLKTDVACALAKEMKSWSCTSASTSTNLKLLGQPVTGTFNSVKVYNYYKTSGFAWAACGNGTPQFTGSIELNGSFVTTQQMGEFHNLEFTAHYLSRTIQIRGTVDCISSGATVAGSYSILASTGLEAESLGVAEDASKPSSPDPVDPSITNPSYTSKFTAN